MTVNLTDPIFNDEEAARAHFERLRWPDGPVCPHCGGVDGTNQADAYQEPLASTRYLMNGNWGRNAFRSSRILGVAEDTSPRVGASQASRR